MKLTVNFLNIVNGVAEQVQVIIEQDGFRDALYYKSADWKGITADVTAAAQARVDGFLTATTAVVAQPVAVMDTTAQRAASVDSLKVTVAGILDQLDALK